MKDYTDKPQKFLFPCLNCGSPRPGCRAAAKRRKFCSKKCCDEYKTNPRDAKHPPSVAGGRWLPLMPSGVFALVDEIDYGRVTMHIWRYHKGRDHVATVVDGQTVMLHHFVLGITDGRLVDHRDGDGTNNRRGNLREASYTQNAQNAIKKRIGKSSSRFKGVHFASNEPGPRRWQAQIRIPGRPRHIGSFATEVEAARAYDDAARQAFGEFACVNFPKRGERSAI